MNVIFPMLFKIFTFQDPILVLNLANLADPSNSTDPWNMVTWSLDQVPVGVVVRNVEGKSRSMLC